MKKIFSSLLALSLFDVSTALGASHFYVRSAGTVGSSGMAACSLASGVISSVKEANVEVAPYNNKNGNTGSSCHIEFESGQHSWFPLDFYPCDNSTSSVCLSPDARDEGQPRRCNSRGNPINVLTGYKHQTEVDSEGVLPFKRYYQHTPAGSTWSHDYSQRLEITLMPNPSLDDHVLWRRDDGQGITFRGTPSTGWQTQTDIPVGLFSTVGPSGAVSSWEVHSRDGVIRHFDQDGRLLSVVSRDGLAINVTYNNDIKTVADLKTGKQLQLSYATGSYEQLESLVNSAGEAFIYEYSPEGMISRVILPDATPEDLTDNPTRVYHYENTNFPEALTGITDENGIRYVTWGYDVKGRAVSSDRAGAEQVTLDYTYIDYLPDPRVTVTNALGKQTVYHYTTINQARKLAHIEGVASTHCAASDNYFGYDKRGFLLARTDARGYVTETIRDSARGLVERQTTGLAWQGDINDSPLVLSNANQRVNTVWHTSFDLPIERTFSGYDIAQSQWVDYRKEVNTYYANGRLETATIHDLLADDGLYTATHSVRTWGMAYTYHDTENTLVATQTINGPLNPSTQPDAVDDIVTYHFDINGNLTSAVNAYQHVVSYSNHNDRGQPTTITDANGVVTTLDYYSRGWLKSSSTALPNGNQVTQYDYYPNGLLKKVTQADNRFLIYEYNDARHLTAIENHMGERVEMQPSLLDGQWETMTVKQANGVIIQDMQRVFDELGRLKDMIGSGSQHTQYRYTVNDQKRFKDEFGYEESGAGSVVTLTSEQVYDALGRIIQHIDADSQVTQFVYDVQGQLKSVIDAEFNTTEYIYNGFGELVKRISPSTGTSIFSYDLAGNRIGFMDDRGVTTTYTYDALSRLVGQGTNLLENSVTYTYDQTDGLHGHGIGRLTRIADQNVILDYKYNAQGLVETKRDELAILPSAILTYYAYDLAGNRSSMTYPSGNQLIYERDTNSRFITGLLLSGSQGNKQLLDNVNYYSFGHGIKTADYSNGLNLILTRSLDGLVEGVQVSGGALIQDKIYQYDAFNNVKGVQDNLDNTKSRNYQYDELHRLTQDSSSAVSAVYQYDSVGNRTNLAKTDLTTNVTTAKQYQYKSAAQAGKNALQLEQVVTGGSSRVLNYNAVGNLESDSDLPAGGSAVFSYDEKNRVKSIVITR